jgi:hypothetical protein
MEELEHLDSSAVAGPQLKRDLDRHALKRQQETQQGNVHVELHEGILQHTRKASDDCNV